MNSVQQATEETFRVTARAHPVRRVADGKKKAKGLSVFTISTLCLLFLILCSLYSGESQGLSRFIQDEVTQLFSWFYSAAMNTYALGCLLLVISPFGKIRLGSSQDSRPEFSTLTWLSMLFSAGMGIGLFFYGVSEPLSHYHVTFHQQATPGEALSLTLLHWGIHPWSCYAVTGLGFAYFHYRRKLPFTISGCLQKVLGSDQKSFIKKTVDTAAVVCPVVGVATSLGLGALQITKGLQHSFGVSSGFMVEISVIGIITLISTYSVVSGVEKGMKYLSIINMALSFIFLSIVFLVTGPFEATTHILADTFSYFQALPGNSVWSATHDFRADGGLLNWTTFYWSSWIAWAPFVGMFIARISKGRTIREFITGVVLIPTLLSAIWFSVLGQSAISLLSDSTTEVQKLLESDLPATFFLYLSRFPVSLILYGLSLVCLKLFFITSSDSAALVIATAASEGKNPTKSAKIYWSLMVSVLAVIFLANGGLETMQVINIVSAVPFALISLIMLASLAHDLWKKESRPGSKLHRF